MGINRIIHTLAFLLLALVATAQVSSDVKDIQVARQMLRVGLDTSKYVQSITNTITSGSTHRQMPTAKAVYDFASALTFTLVTTPTLSGAGTSGSPLTIAQQGATNGQPLEWNSSLGRWAPGTDDGTTYTGGTGISVSGTVINNTGDLSTTNELVTGFSVVGSLLRLSQPGGGFDVALTSIAPDQSTTNEIQSLSLTGQALGISLGGTGVTLPLIGVLPGTGISVGTVGGNATVTNTGDTDATNDITNTTTATNDLSGTYPGPTVARIQGRAVATTAPTTNQVLKWNGTAWAPGTDDNSGATYTGGTGISVVGTVISNTAPDQVVALTPGTGIGVSGTYPNFTLTNTGDTNASDDITGSGVTNRIAYYSGTQAITSNAGLTTTDGTDIIATRLRAGSGASRRTAVVTGSTAFSDNAIRINTNLVWNSGTGAIGTYFINLEYTNTQAGTVTAVAGIIKICIITFSGTGVYFHVNVLGEWGRSTTATLYKNASDEIVIYLGEITDDGPFGVYLTDVYSSNPAAVGNIVTGITGAGNTTGLTSVATCQNIVQTRTVPYRLNLSGAANTVNHVLQLGGSGNVDSEIGIIFNAFGGVDGTTLPTTVGTGIWNIAAKRRGASAPDLFFRRNGVDVVAMTNENRLGVGVAPTSTTARITTRGEGATSGTLSFLAENSAGTDALWALDNATVGIAGTGGTATSITGRDANNIISNVTVGSGLTFASGTLSAANLYNTNGTLSAQRTVTMGGNLLIWNASAITNPDVFAIQGGSGVTRAFILQNNLGSPIGHISYRDTMVTVGTYAGANARLQADAYSLELTRQGAVVIPDNTTPPASNKLGALTFNSNSNGLFLQAQTGAAGVERVATVQNDLTPNTLNLITGTHTLSGKNWTSRADANAGAFTITLGVQLEEGRDYVVMCKRNGTNAVTFTAAAGYNLSHALDTALTSGNLVAGSTGTGLAAPGNTYYIRRSGTIISIK